MKRRDFVRLTGSGVSRDITFTNGDATGGTDALNLALGGLLRSNESGGSLIGTATARGILTAGGTATTGTTELVIYHNQSTITIHSVIADNELGNSVGLVKTGNGALTLTAANTYAGMTTVTVGTLASVAGDSSDPGDEGRR